MDEFGNYNTEDMTNTEITLLTALIIAILYCIYLSIRLGKLTPNDRYGISKDTSRFPGHRNPPPPPVDIYEALDKISRNAALGMNRTTNISFIYGGIQYIIEAVSVKVIGSKKPNK